MEWARSLTLAAAATADTPNAARALVNCQAVFGSAGGRRGAVTNRCRMAVVFVCKRGGLRGSRCGVVVQCHSVTVGVAN